MNDVQTLLESAGDDRELAVELLEMFQEQAMEEIGVLTDASQRCDAKEVARTAHKLVGSAVACGFISLSKELRSIELQGLHNGSADIKERIEILNQLLEEGCNEMIRRLADEKIYEEGAHS